MAELTDVTELEAPSTSVIRFIDREAGVVLYADSGANLGGMTSMPISDTNLE